VAPLYIEAANIKDRRHPWAGHARRLAEIEGFTVRLVDTIPTFLISGPSWSGDLLRPLGNAVSLCIRSFFTANRTEGL